MSHESQSPFEISPLLTEQARERMHARIGELRAQLSDSLARTPDDLDGRSPLWIEMATLEQRLHPLAPHKPEMMTELIGAIRRVIARDPAEHERAAMRDLAWVRQAQAAPVGRQELAA